MPAPLLGGVGGGSVHGELGVGFSALDVLPSQELLESESLPSTAFRRGPVRRFPAARPHGRGCDCRTLPAIRLGAIGHPGVTPGILENGILLPLRFQLKPYINLRPVKLYDERFCPLKDKKPEDIDFVVVRENNEGLYTGAGGFVFKGTPHEVALQESVNTRRGVERCLRFAFEFTRTRNKDKKLT